MTHAGIIDSRRCPEPSFDPPPSFRGIYDRRLSERIAAEWADRKPRRAAGASTMMVPAAPDFGAKVAPRDGHCVWLERRNGVVEITEVGALVARIFAVWPGAADASPFARAIAVAFERSMELAEPALFEGGFARHPGAAATLLTRGVVMPLTDDREASRACAVVTWTETITPAENNRLRRELLAALRETPVRVAEIPSFAIW